MKFENSIVLHTALLKMVYHLVVSRSQVSFAQQKWYVKLGGRVSSGVEMSM